MTNKYFKFYPTGDHIDNESLVMESMIVESIEIMGHECYYIPRESFDAGDMILGEYSKSFFEKAYKIDCYISNVQGFEGDNDFFSKFGLEVRDSASFVLSKRHFTKLVPTTVRQRPREGDLVYVPVFHRMFEIKFIEEEQMFFSLGKRNPFVYEMKCEMFRYSQEPINTGVEEIDIVREQSAYTIKVSLGAGSGDYAIDDTVFRATSANWNNRTASAKIKDWVKANGTIFLNDVIGEFTPGANLYSNTTGASYIISTKDELSDYNDRDFFDNIQLKDQANTIIDTTETNIFGTT